MFVWTNDTIDDSEVLRATSIDKFHSFSYFEDDDGKKEVFSISLTISGTGEIVTWEFFDEETRDECMVNLLAKLDCQEV